MLCITLSAAYAVARFLSITSVYSVETNKHLQFFSPSDSHTSFFYTKHYGTIPTRGPERPGRRMQGKNRDSQSQLGPSRAVNGSTA